jgi:hypothetical protein
MRITRRARTPVVLFAVIALFLAAAPAWSHHDETTDDGTKRNSRHALHDFSHEDGEPHHIAKNVNYGLRPLGSIAPDGVQSGRYTDIWADGNHAYIGTFEEPTCDRSGVFIANISNPAAPTNVAHIKSPPDTRVNDVKTIRLDNKHFTGTVLIHTLEPCGTIPGLGATKGQGGISLYNVSKPRRPVALKRNFLDFGVHNTFPWTVGNKTFLILVDDDHAIDVHILNITRPQSPKLISSTGLPDWLDAQDAQSEGIGAFAASFNHDVWVQEIGGENIALISYWDAGWVKLDVSDPANPAFIDDSTYPDPDPISGVSPPEGNAHAGVFDATGTRIYAGDEDFDPFRIVAEITSGPFMGEEFSAAQGSDTPQIGPDVTSLTGPTAFVGLACNALGSDLAAPTADTIAVVERGVCTFTTKATNVEDAGYAGTIVFNSEDGSPPCDATVSPLVEGDKPFLFVTRSTGFKILGITGYNPDNCPGGENPALPAPGTEGESVDIEGIFDGWAYFHLLEQSTLTELGYYSPGEVFDEDYAQGFGDLSMHNVEGDPDTATRGYIAWYSLGMRAFELDPGFMVEPPGGDWDAATPGVDDYYGSGVREVGRFIADDGSNFWGVHVHVLPDETKLILASDRNTGIHIFVFDPTFCDPCP